MDVAIVGAGPVGLWTAIQIKKNHPACRVTMFERHREYVRSHVLRLDHLSILLYGSRTRNDREREFFLELVGGEGVLNAAKSVFVRTNALEAALRRYALDLGVSIKHQMVDSPEDIEKQIPGALAYIAADGAHSRMRKALLGENNVFTRDLQRVVEIKYESSGTSRNLDFVKEGYKTQKLLSFMTFEYVGRTKEGVTPVTLRMFLDKNTYDSIPAATFKAPLPLDHGGLPQKLTADLQTYLNVRRDLAGEEYVPQSGKLTKLVLSSYRSRRFAVNHSGNRWYLVGDAAMGVPYFRALNSGLLAGSLLARVVCLRARHPSLSRVSLSTYAWFAAMRYLTEVGIAQVKNSALMCFDFYRRKSSAVAWQTTKWTDEAAFLYRTQEHRAFDVSNSTGVSPDTPVA